MADGERKAERQTLELRCDGPDGDEPHAGTFKVTGTREDDGVTFTPDRVSDLRCPVCGRRDGFEAVSAVKARAKAKR